MRKMGRWTMPPRPLENGRDVGGTRDGRGAATADAGFSARRTWAPGRGTAARRGTAGRGTTVRGTAVRRGTAATAAYWGAKEEDGGRPAVLLTATGRRTTAGAAAAVMEARAVRARAARLAPPPQLHMDGEVGKGRKHRHVYGGRLITQVVNA